jgi:hypothetical protein
MRTRLAVFGGLAVAALLTTVAPATAAQDAILTTTMTGAGENPPNASPGTGTAVVFVDADSHMACISFRFSGLVAPSTNGHIHEGAAGTNGPVRIPFSPPATFGGTSGGKFFCTTVAADILDRLTANPAGWYVNIHSTVFPGGEIRGQLKNA